MDFLVDQLANQTKFVNTNQINYIYKYCTSIFMNILKSLQLVIKSYDTLPVNKLIQNNLNFRIVFPVPKDFLSNVDIPQYQAKLIDSRCNSFALVIIHSQLQPPNHLSTAILENIPETVVLSSDLDSQSKKIEQINNILHMHIAIKKKIKHFKAIMVPITTKLTFQNLTNDFKWYFSVIQTFFAHLHIQIHCHSVQHEQNIQQLILNQKVDQEQQEEYLNSLPQNCFVKYLHQRASRISLSELSQISSLENKKWGKTLLFDQGSDVLVIWMTVGGYPFFGLLPSRQQFAQKGLQIVEFERRQMSCSFFKHKNRKQTCLKTAYCEPNLIQFMVFVIDFQQSWFKRSQIKQWRQILIFQMEKIFMLFCKLSVQKKCQRNLSDNLQYIEKISELLGIQSDQLTKKIFKI